MTIKQIYTDCLAEAAYFIESEGIAAVIDPLRDIEQYLDCATMYQSEIKFIFLTHLHADFMAGHQDLARVTGAKIVIGPTDLSTGYEVVKAVDGEVFDVGQVKLKVLHTPGHTPEHICLLLFDENGKQNSLFTGDTLFIGDVGRPDLAQKVIAEFTQEKLARMLYHSLRHKIMTLPDDVIIYPNHGAGSPCGKNISPETFDTLGNQKLINYALRSDQTEEEFVTELLEGLSEPPTYFPQMVLGNLNGVQSIFDIRKKSEKALSVDDFFNIQTSDKEVIIIDTRDAREFILGHIPSSINIELDSYYAIWSGTILRDVNTPILLVTQIGREKEAINRMARVGFDNIQGFLEGGYDSWKNSQYHSEIIPSASINDFLINSNKHSDYQIIDVRRKSEFDSEHLISALNFPVDYWWEALRQINSNITYFVHCKSGSRSVMFISIMKMKGYHNFINIIEDFEFLKTTKNIEVTEYICPTSFL